MLSLHVLLLALVLAGWAVQGKFDDCGLSSNTRFLTFNRKLMSGAPVLFPKTEAELKSIVRRAAQRGCRVRVRGSGHSSNGIIAQMAEKKVVVVHLGRLKTSAWPDAMNAKTCVATIGAGKSLLGLIAMAKPAGCVMITQTAFPMFSVGGVIANSVTGNGHGAGMLYDYVVGVRVMLPTGEVRTITDESSLRFFRGAYGLTGIILSIKYQLKRDYQFQMKSMVSEYDLFNGGQSAYVALATDQARLLAMYSGSECFMNVYPSQTTGKQSVSCFVLTQATTNQTFPSGSSQDKATQAELVALYNKVKKQNPNLSYTGGKLANVGSACDLIPAPFCYSKLAVSAGMMQSSTVVYNGTWTAAGSAMGARDGYNQFTNLYPFTALAMFVPANMLVQAVGAYMQILGPFLGQGENASWLPNLAFEWRPVTPKGSSAFDILVGGTTYYQVEVVQLSFTSPAMPGFGTVMQHVQQAWASLGGIPHAAKDYGFSAAGVPFQTKHKFYSQAQVDAVNAKLDKLDPKRTFSAGSSLWDFRPSKYVNYTQIDHPEF